LPARTPSLCASRLDSRRSAYELGHVDEVLLVGERAI
jgi:hypothetical protein